jgi:hypothetical protein
VEAPAKSEQHRLDSWKEIAAYLRRDERTVQRWESERGLPVHRTPSGKRGNVFAYREDLDRWLTAQDGEFPLLEPQATTLQSPRSFGRRALWPPVLAVATFVLLAIAGVFLARGLRERPAPLRLTATTDSIIAWDDAGRRLWEHRYPKGVFIPPEPDAWINPKFLSQIVDVDGDGKPEVLVAVHQLAVPPTMEFTGGELDCFSSDGRLRWRYVPEITYKFGGREFSPRVIRAFLVANPGPAATIWVAVVHYLWWPSAVVQVEARTGRGVARFVNSGSTYSLAVLGSGEKYRILVGTFNNEYDRGAMAVLDPAQPFAASPQSKGSPYHCDACPAGDPEAYYLFPRSELNQLERVGINPVAAVVVRAEHVDVETQELSPVHGRLEYYFTVSDHAPTGFAFGDDYWREHRRLEAAGRVNHKAEDCPDRRTPRRVQMFTANGGWRDLLVPPAPEAQ